MALLHCTLFVVPFLFTITIMLVILTQRGFALTTSRISRQNTDGHKSQSPQQHAGHKCLAQQDIEDHKSLSLQRHLKSTAHHVSPCLLALIVITVVAICISRFLLLLISPSWQDLLHSQRDFKSMAPRPLPYPQAVMMPPRMHWIQDPASYQMMQHQSHVALYRESAMANTYVPTPLSPNLTLTNN